MSWARRPELAAIVPPRAGWSDWLLAGLGYLALAILATWPVAARFGAAIPGELTDPLEHLWIMRWLRSCLLAGQNPLFCSAIQAPIGVPLGYFPTLHLQTVLYMVARLLSDNDAAIFTTIWFLGFVATGLASFGLARWALPGLHLGVAWVAGLGVMLCGPMLMHAHGHLETMQMGVVPPFLIAWIQFNDRPGWSKLVVAAACYLLVVAAAPYFAVLAIFPAAWYAAWLVLVAPTDNGGPWGRARRLTPWLVGFGLLVLPGVALLFGGQIWAAAQGFPMTRSKRLFDHFGAPVWSALVPSPRHALGSALVPSVFKETGYAGRMTECSSYLGLVALGLLGYAALRRVQFPRRGFWWSVLAWMVVLSWGSRLDVSGVTIPLPAGWIYGIFPPFHLIRVPARFNLFAAVVAVVPVAAALRDLVSRTSGTRVPAAILGTFTIAMLADLAMVPFPTAEIPDPPAFYADLKRAKPTAQVLDAPLFDSARGQTFSSLWGYWQQRTGLSTSGGYPGLTNARFDAEIARPSVFGNERCDAFRTFHSDRPEPTFASSGLMGDMGLHDRVWIELTAHGYDYAILHHAPSLVAEYGPSLAELAANVAEAAIPGDAETTVIARARLKPPTELTWTASRGFWRLPVPEPADAQRFGVLREASLTLFQPDPPRAREVMLTLTGVGAFAHTRVVRLLDSDRELCRWSIEPRRVQTLQSPRLTLPPGLHTWTFRSDGDDQPTRRADRLDDAATPYSFRLGKIQVALVSP